MGYSKPYPRLNTNCYNPSSGYFQNQMIGIRDHGAEKGQRKFHILPFNSPPKQKFETKIILSDIEDTILNKKINFYSKEGSLNSSSLNL